MANQRLLVGWRRWDRYEWDVLITQEQRAHLLVNDRQKKPLAARGSL
ncbi:MAG: hypothetical protein WDM87_04225 [Terracidiphilus sp.]